MRETEQADRPEGEKWSIKRFLFELATNQPLQRELLAYGSHEERLDFYRQFVREDHVQYIDRIKLEWTIEAEAKLTDDAPPEVDPKVIVKSMVPTW